MKVEPIMIWAGTRPRLMSDILIEDFGINPPVELAAAEDISADGRVIVGSGRDLVTGQNVGWVVALPSAIPSPATIATLPAFGLMALLRRRRAVSHSLPAPSCTY